MSPDRDPAAATRRRNASTKSCAKNPEPGKDCDEYPQAMFVENAGRAHVKKINLNDNRGSGTLVGNYARAYRAGDQLEVIVPSGSLYCRNAF